MKKIRVLAVDDEPLALRQLEMYIGKVSFLELVAACRSALEARRVMDEADVDALFLDINMPDISGMEFVRALQDPPLIVFTTAYSEYAVEGFRVDAVDYLLKPFSLAEFIAAAGRVRQRLEARPAAPAPMDLQAQDDAVFFRADARTVRVRLSDIRYIESMSEYVKIYLDSQPDPLVVLYSLKRLVEELPADKFMRIHRSYIIALDRIREASASSVVLETPATTLPVGESYRPAFRKFLAEK